jgi:dihydroorotate dehydrogenase (fumarate)
MEPDLTTTYLGLRLRNPLVVSASPLSKRVDVVRRLEAAGAAAVVLHSLFEEEIIRESHEHDAYLERGALGHAEAFSYFPHLASRETTPDRYLKHLEEVRRAVAIPVIGSLNGVSSGGWVTYARQIEEAGADALELNLYYVPTDPDLSGAELEAVYLRLVRDVCATVRIPVAVKLSPFFTSIPHMAQQVVEAGADGLVLFNRFYQPDFDLESFELVPKVELCTSHDLRLPLRWIAILYRRVATDFALTGGVHTAEDAVKGLMAGASVVMLASALLSHGIDRLSQVLRGLASWLDAHGYPSVAMLIGSLSQRTVAEPAAFERAHYISALNSIAAPTAPHMSPAG